MSALALNPQEIVRFAVFALVLAAMAAWEGLAPKRALTQSKGIRWYGNLGVLAVDAVLLRAVAGLGPMAAAGLAAAKGWGLFNLLSWPEWLVVFAAVLALDLAIYFQHVMFHAVPALWRLHRMHHADLDFDVTTGVRFHPLEILISAGIKSGVVLVLGAPAAAVLAFEVILNATSMFNHGNVRMPAAVDRVLRLVVVTPDMHRVHHSIVVAETNSNFGFNLPWWDRLFGTYRAQPQAGHDRMTIGIELFRDPTELHLHRLLVQPFVGPAGRQPINRPGETNREEDAVDDDVFNIQVRKFLKQVGVTSQREIEGAVRDAIAQGRLKGRETLDATMTLEIGSLGFTKSITGKIALE